MKLKRIVLIFLFTAIAIFCIQTKSYASSQTLNELNFDVQVNSDGSMNVKETWDIEIYDTNTLFKTFKTDETKYSGITNVSVKDVTNNKNFEQINEEMYHVTKDCFYGLINSKGMFEIAWGVDLENKTETRKYEISYTVQDAIAKYSDFAELYWQFVGEDFEIEAKKIKGTILLPQSAETKDDIKVWGHTEDLNGEIYATDLNKIEFEIRNYTGEKYIEIRSLFPNNMIEVSNRTYDKEILNSVIEEETKWAEEANARREMKKNMRKVGLGLEGIVALFFGFKFFKNIKKLREMEKKYKPTMKLDYFRELPYVDATPAEALFMFSQGLTKNFASSFSANVLDLTLKKYLSLEAGTNGSGLLKEDIVKFKFLNDGKEELKEDQRLVLDFLKTVAGEREEITTKDITKYLKKHVSKVDSLDKKTEKTVENFEIKRKVYDKKKNEEHENYVGFSIIYFVFAFFACLTLFGIPLGIVWAINGIVLALMAHKTNVFSQEGVDEYEKWKALKKYMEDFSLLKEKEVPSLVVWEKFLVFATAFGISEKVIKQLKVVYPEINNMENGIYTYNYIHLMDSVNIGNCINSSVYSAVGSSGSGAGGGFSGGGGGGRRPEVAAADAR